VIVLPDFLASIVTFDATASACAHVNGMQDSGSRLTLFLPTAAPMNTCAVGTTAGGKLMNACDPVHVTVDEGQAVTCAPFSGGPSPMVVLVCVIVTWLIVLMPVPESAGCETSPEAVVSLNWRPSYLVTAFESPMSVALLPSLSGTCLLVSAGSVTRALLALSSQQTGRFLALPWQQAHRFLC